MKLSILVPIYNSAATLPLFLDSIKAQKLRDFEAILVDDGSTDHSLKILKTYAAEDKRFKVFSRQNCGYGASLNFALTKAKGKYVAIAEPDDFLHSNLYKELVSLLESSGADIAKSSFFNYYAKTGKAIPERVFHEVFHKNKVTILSPKKDQAIFLVDPSIWSCVFNRKFLLQNKITFSETPGASFQDSGFQFKTFAAAKSVVCTPQQLYYYRRDNSQSSVKSSAKIFSVKQEFDSVDQFIDQDFATISAACRFRSYNWNLNRLPFKAALRFAKVAKADYQNLSAKITFSANFFRQHHLKRGFECAFSTKFPGCYVFLRPVFHCYNSLKRAIFSLVSRV